MNRRQPLTKTHLLPLAAALVRQQQLRLPRSVVDVTRSACRPAQLAMLLNVVEITYLLASSEEREAVSIARFRQAEAALEARLEQIGEGGGVMIDAIEREAIEYVSTLHDQQLLGVPSHRYLEAQERVKQLAQAGQSAIPDLAQ